MSSEQDNNDAISQASQNSQPQFDYAGSDDEKGERQGENSDSDNNSNKDDDNEDDPQVNGYQQFIEETPDWRKKWQFQKGKQSAPIQTRRLQDDERMTNPIITKHQYAKIIGLRAKQIYSGSALYHLPPKQILQKPNMIKIAQQQLKNKAIPFVIQRMHSNGEYELWRIDELQK